MYVLLPTFYLWIAFRRVVWYLVFLGALDPSLGLDLAGVRCERVARRPALQVAR